MLRLGSLLLLATAATAACTSGTGMGMASVTGITPAVKSADAVPFSGLDGAGNKILGWKIELSDAAPGADCTSGDVKTRATIGIYTTQADDGTHKQAMLPSQSDIVIIEMTPPTVNGTAAANMGGSGVANIQGSLHIDEFHLDPKGNADSITGSLNAVGLNDAGAAVNVTGPFTAPVCKS